MTILAAADIHGALGVYEWLVRLAQQPQTGALILAGDLFGGGWEREQTEEARRIVPVLQQAPVPVLYLMGNDDFVWLGHEDERIQLLHNRRLELGDYGFVGYQYTPPFLGTIFEKTESAMEKDAALLEPLLDAQTVFVTHGPIFGVLDRVGGRKSVGSRALAALLERRPVLAHIHGHIHECFGREGNHFNVAAAARRRAVWIELPSLRHQVVQAG